MDDGIWLAEALLGLPGLRVLAVTETRGEMVIAPFQPADAASSNRR